MAWTAASGLRGSLACSPTPWPISLGPDISSCSLLGSGVRASGLWQLIPQREASVVGSSPSHLVSLLNTHTASLMRSKCGEEVDGDPQVPLHVSKERLGWWSVPTAHSVASFLVLPLVPSSSSTHILSSVVTDKT